MKDDGDGGSDGREGGGGRDCTCCCVHRSVLRIAREVSQEVVREMKVGQFYQTKQTTGDTGELVVRDVQVSQTIPIRERYSGERAKTVHFL